MAQQAIMQAITYLPDSVQEKIQQIMIKAMQNPYAIPLGSVPAAFVLCYVPHFFKFGLMASPMNKGVLSYNNETPRGEDLRTYKFLPNMMLRAKSAHENGLEMFPMYAAAVIIAKVQKVDPKVLTPLCLRYLTLRLLYTFLYIFGVNRFVALMRTLSWVSMFNLVLQISVEGL